MMNKKRKIWAVITATVLVIAMGLAACQSAPKQMTNDEARVIMNELLPRAREIYLEVGGYHANMDETQLMPGNDMYALYLGDYKSIADIKVDVESIFTKECAEDEFYWRFELEDGGYKEYDGKLYQSIYAGGAGYSLFFLPDTATVQSQEGDHVVVKVETEYEEYPSVLFEIEKVDGEWLIAVFAEWINE